MKRKQLTNAQILARITANASARGLTLTQWVQSACTNGFHLDAGKPTTEIAANGKAKRIKLTREEREAKHKREAELFAELSERHGYTIVEMKPKERTGFVYDRVAGLVTTTRYAKLAAPTDSWLAQSLDKLVNVAAAAKAKGLVTAPPRKEPKPRPSRAKRENLSQAEKVDRDSRWGGASRR